MSRACRSMLLAGGLALALALAVAPVAPRAQDDTGPLRFSAGGVTGLYFALSSSFCRLLWPDLGERLKRCDVASSQGSVSNLRLVRAGVADLGLAQADLVPLALAGAWPFEVDGPNPNLRVLFSTVLEKLTVVTAPNSGIQSLDDMLGRAVDFGPPGSGSLATAVRFLDSVGYSLDDFVSASSATSALNPQHLCDGESDAFAFIAAHPNSVVEEAMATCGAGLLPGRSEVMDTFTQKFPEYYATEIDASLYPLLDYNVATFGVPAIVIADARLPDEVAYRLTKTVFENLEALHRLQLAFVDLTVE
ncbi:MAG: TAXI family TRAP transporter solute-binding subunit, partial [Geminicoccaceae bacterium]